MEATYKKLKTIVNKRLKDGSLPKEYAFPPYSFFEPLFKKLKPLEKTIPKPEYIFVPQGLTYTQWDKLLKKTCKGAWHSDYIPNDFHKGSDWALWIMSGADKELERNISKEALEQRGDVLPTAQALLAQQWLRLEQGREPVDKQTWSIAKENVTVGGVLRSVFLRFYPYDRSVYSYWDDRGFACDSTVVRASGESENLVLDPSSSFDSSATTELQKLLDETYRRGRIEGIAEYKKIIQKFLED